MGKATIRLLIAFEFFGDGNVRNLIRSSISISICGGYDHCSGTSYCGKNAKKDILGIGK